MTVRYTDPKGGSSLSRDFIARKHKPTLQQILIIFTVVLIINALCTMMLPNRITAVTLQIVMLGAVGAYGVFNIQRSRDMMLATQFQNALFASALNSNNKYCLIIQRDGNVIYMDRGFQLMFPDLRKDTQLSMDTMFQHGKVDVGDKEKILAAIERGTHDKVIYEIRSADNRVNKLVMSIEPISCPEGFIMLRSREFVQQRAGESAQEIAAVAKNPLLNVSIHNLFAAIMNKMQIGMLITDPLGKVICANPLLERWLAFHKGEIGNQLSFKEVVFQAGTQPSTETPEEFEGEAIFQKKEGGMIKMLIKQKIIQNSDDQMLGYVALVDNPLEQDKAIKKKAW